MHEAAAGLGDRAAAFTVDVTDAGAMTAVMDEVAARHGGIDAVVANAGISGPNATVESVDPAAFERVVEVNLLGVWRTVRAALPHVRARRGYILMTSSIAAAIPCPTVAGYAASKAGIEAFGRALRIELAHTGTQVGIAYFGAVDTELVRGLITRPALREGLEKMPRRPRRADPGRPGGRGDGRMASSGARGRCTRRGGCRRCSPSARSSRWPTRSPPGSRRWPG